MTTDGRVSAEVLSCHCIKMQTLAPNEFLENLGFIFVQSEEVVMPLLLLFDVCLWFPQLGMYLCLYL